MRESRTDWIESVRLHQGGIWKVPASGGAAEPVISTNAQNGRLSPDMKWMAFTSAQSGRQEVYLATFPKPGGWLPVSVDGGSDTHWSADGHEMFFMAGDRKLMVVRIDTQRPDPRVTAPRVLFERRAAAGMHPAEPAARNYCSSPDGTRFLVNTLLTTAEANGITLIQNWTPRQRPSADQRR